MIGDFVNYLPGNVQDLSLPGARAAYLAPHNVLPYTEDWTFLQSIGQEAGRFAMAGPLPGRYYGLPWLKPGGYSMMSVGAGIAPNSGYGTGVASSLMTDGGSAPAPAADIPQAEGAVVPISPDGSFGVSTDGSMIGATNTIAPITLTTPMPSVLQPRHNQVTPSDLTGCGLSRWVSGNPLLAVGVAAALYLVLKGSRK